VIELEQYGLTGQFNANNFSSFMLNVTHLKASFASLLSATENIRSTPLFPHHVVPNTTDLGKYSYLRGIKPKEN
jgi:hypothetical protein